MNFVFKLYFVLYKRKALTGLDMHNHIYKNERIVIVFL